MFPFGSPNSYSCVSSLSPVKTSQPLSTSSWLRKKICLRGPGPNAPPQKKEKQNKKQSPFMENLGPCPHPFFVTLPRASGGLVHDFDMDPETAPSRKMTWTRQISIWWPATSGQTYLPSEPAFGWFESQVRPAESVFQNWSTLVNQKWKQDKQLGHHAKPKTAEKIDPFGRSARFGLSP